MNILHLLSQRPDSTGSGVYVQAVMAKAVEHGYSNALVAGIPQSYCVPETVRELCAVDILAVRFEQDISFPIVGMSDVMPYTSTCFSDLGAPQIARYEQCFEQILQKAVEKHAPDIIHANHLWLLTALACRMFPDIPVVASCHGSDLRQFRQCPHLRDRVRAGCAGLAAVMALSCEQKETIVRLYGLDRDKVAVTGAGFKETLFVPSSQRFRPPPVHMVYAGKLSRAKGVPWLLRACRRLDHDFVLHVAGSGCGQEEQDIQALAASLGDRVVMHGALSQQQLAGLLGRSHMFVLPSFFEGLPLVLLEALASGCSLVATDLPGIAEIFKELPPQVIRRVPLPRMQSVDSPYPEHEEDFVQALVRALDHQMAVVRAGYDVQACGEARKLLERFTWSGVFERINAVYQRVMKSDNGACKRTPVNGSGR
ncbi:glycosyltransferase [Desulfoplanes formicivorans]|uniref:Group 1 glycosyl transferase n=1 Tax=Desulfoplanes formicivorans TaxID=1592317 RepID=A0A194AH39_9BACT|nr:glycosyltransferase [Desulfoplanes formicivorans]GAU08638.1 group 1 glycosyl transferase [Desulfoplanes formicivorans]